MERTRKRCAHCHQTFRTKRNPAQHHCAKQACQNARKRHWRKHKHIGDPDYRENRRRANKKWKKHHAGYWRKYRTTHPEYVERNRQQQQQRDRQRAKSKFERDASPLAKGDALAAKNAIQSGVYRITPVPDIDLAKSDALLVKISLMTTS